MRFGIAIGLAVVFLSASAFSQSNVASITGILTDPSGAVVPNGDVTITNVNTGIVYATRTNEAGVYAAPSLIAGPYDVEVRAGAGFKSKKIQNVVLEGGQKMRLDVTLEVGAVTEQIEVKATTAPLQQETAEISETIAASEILGLPLGRREPLQLMSLFAGITTVGSDPNSMQYYGAVSVSGGRALGNSVVVDGAPLTHIGGWTESPGSIEAFQEIKLLSSTYSAEYGRTSGGVFIFQVKSGTQNYHGTAYEYHRNSALNANNWANNANGIKPSSLIRNEFGANFGGPIPRMKQKLFFFASYEGVQERTPQNRTRTIPDPAIRGGNFSGLPAVINDPLSGAPFANNTIPSNRLDPAAVKFLQLFPAPNVEGTFNPRFGIRSSNWFLATHHNEPFNKGVLRLDYTPTDKDKFFLTYSHINEGPFDFGADFANAINSVNGPPSRNMPRVSLGYTRFLRPNLTNEFLASVQRDPRKQAPFFKFDVTAELGIQRKTGEYLPSVGISGFGGFGNSLASQWINQPAVLSDITTLLRGRHTLRFGAQLYQNQYWYIGNSNSSGNYSFNGEITGLGSAGRDHPLNALADLLLGAVKTAGISAPQIPVNRLNYNLGMFANDDWKVTSRLTINLGLRYEFEKKQIVKNNVYSRVDLATGNLLVAGKNASRNLNLNNDYLNFSPRLGVAYSLNDRTVIRSGFAIFHSNFWVDNGELVNYTGWTASRDFVDQGLSRAQPFTFREGFPVEEVPAVGDPLAAFAAATPGSPLSVTNSTYNPNDRLPYNIQWNFGIQRAIGFDTVLDVAYVGSRSVRLDRGVAANNPRLDRAPAVVIDRVPIQQVRPFPNLSDFGAVFYDATANYHSLQAKANRRFRADFSLDASYTFSKNIDTASNQADSFQIPWQFASLERALSSLDRTHVFSLGSVYALPFGKDKSYFSGNRLVSALLGGFQVNGLLLASSGVPFTITQRKTNLILASQRPDVIDPKNLRGRVAEPQFVGAARTWLIRTGEPGFPFRPSSNVGIGNLGRNTSRAPGFWNVNLSVFRTFPITEKARLEFRFEAFNALNHVNFLGPSGFIDSAGYGLSTGASPARDLQLGARLSF